VRVWAPRADEVRVRLIDTGDEIPLRRAASGWHTGDSPGLVHGTDYLLVLDGEPVTDPRARWLPHGVHGPARWWDPATVTWTDEGWHGRELRAATCLYELHVGTFTTAGTLKSAVDRLDHLVSLGVTHVELLPLAAFDGVHGWGYDGVAIDAVHEPYGGPDALCRFVDACHARRLAVVVDVVHNHLGPSGNYWARFGPFLTTAHQTPWGEAVNLDQPGSDDVRAILLDSVTNWLRDFHLDGLRLDAVHELVDRRAFTFLEELSETVEVLSVELGRPLSLIAETDRNDPRTVTPRTDGGLGMTAQWDDDVHHALHWLITGEASGYYSDFASVDSVMYALEHAFLHDGRWSSFRGRTHGRPVNFSRVDPWRFVVALQTHDQIGNRATGDRLSHLADVNRLAAGAAVLLTLPYTPMLFMGEEWGASTPWCFCSSYASAELARKVTEGRRAEFAPHGWRASDVPDPQDPQTFYRSKLDWSEPTQDPHRQLLQWYRDLIALRQAEPSLAAAPAAPGNPGRLHCMISEDGAPRSVVTTRPGWVVAANFAADALPVDVDPGTSKVWLAWPSPNAVETAAERLLLDPYATAILKVDNPLHSP
jgi:maltooligosyltrehalose trehalohydrolase